MNIPKRLFNILGAVIGKGRVEIEKIVKVGGTLLDKELEELEGKRNIGGERDDSSEMSTDEPISALNDDLRIFNLRGDVSFEDVKKSYRRECRKYHSDLHQADPGRKETADEIMKIYNSAYNRLKEHYGKTVF